MTTIKTHELKRRLPEWARVVKDINGVPVYNINIFQNIVSWNVDNSDVPAFDYYGTIIKYGELPEIVNDYIKAFRRLGIGEKDVVTLCLPVSIENMISLLALNCMGAISNNVNYLFLKSDFDLYTKDKNSNSLIILDAFLPAIIDKIKDSEIKNIVITSLSDYLPEDNKHIFEHMSDLPDTLKEVFDNENAVFECKKKIVLMQNKNFIRFPEILEEGKMDEDFWEDKPVDVERDVSYSYTSGTTGIPKCIVYKEQSTNAFIEMHNGIDTKDYVGERVFQAIPLTHSTGERVSGYLQLAKGKTLCPQPIYNKETFGIDLMKSKCNWVLATPSFYLAAVAKGVIADDALSSVTRPSSGGEPVTKSNIRLIDEWLKRNGCKVRFALGGGSSEDGSGVLFTYNMDEDEKTNETGYPIEPFIKVKILNEDGTVVKKGERGYLHISSPAAADRYLDDEAATQKRWYMDKEGIRWSITGDIAVQNPNGSYNILGRATDSYISESGEVKYLFDIENSLDINAPVLEWEITAHNTMNGTYVVGQVVLKESFLGTKYDAVKFLCEKYALDSVKVYEKFDTNDVTAKRDFQKLENDKKGYLKPISDGRFQVISYENNERNVVKEISV